jgi:hypothetical protein
MNDTYYGYFQAQSEEEAGFMMLLITYLCTYYFGPDLVSLSFQIYENPVD